MSIATHQFEVVYKGGLRNLATHLQSGSQIETDAPTDNEGNGERFSPTDLLCVSLATCMMTIMGIKAKAKNIILDGTELFVKKVMLSEPRRIGEIHITFVFDKKLNLDSNDTKIFERVAHTCPVKYSIHPDIKVVVNFNW